MSTPSQPPNAQWPECPGSPKLCDQPEKVVPSKPSGLEVVADPRRTSPRRAFRDVTCLFENRVKRPVLGRRFQEQTDGFVQCGARRGGRVAVTGDVQRHGMGDLLIPLAPGLYGGLDLHERSMRSAGGLGKPPVSGLLSESDRACLHPVHRVGPPMSGVSSGGTAAKTARSQILPDWCDWCDSRFGVGPVGGTTRATKRHHRVSFVISTLVDSPRCLTAWGFNRRDAEYAEKDRRNRIQVAEVEPKTTPGIGSQPANNLRGRDGAALETSGFPERTGKLE